MAEPKKAKPKASAAKQPARADESAGKKAAPKAKAAARPKAKAPSKAAPKGRQPAAGKSTSSPDIYTDPALRDKLKAEITAGDKGGKPGQWSARKAQLLAHEYEKAGGDYKNGKKKKTAAQGHLDQWTDEDWKTADGKPAEREGGTARYLPAEAWDELTPAQKKATNAKKQAGSRQGKQFVGNTAEAKEARKAATKGGEPATAAKAQPKAKAKAKAPDASAPKSKPKAADAKKSPAAKKPATAKKSPAAAKKPATAKKGVGAKKST